MGDPKRALISLQNLYSTTTPMRTLLTNLIQAENDPFTSAGCKFLHHSGEWKWFWYAVQIRDANPGCKSVLQIRDANPGCGILGGVKAVKSAWLIRKDDGSVFARPLCTSGKKCATIVNMFVLICFSLRQPGVLSCWEFSLQAASEETLSC